MKPYCYTVGHSNYCFAQFMDMLHYHGITTVVDVRSLPYSKFVPHFNREELRERLKQMDIKYNYAGRELGGREQESGNLEEVVQGQEFQNGIENLLSRITAGETVAIMCSEKDPFNCHRFFLVTYALEDRGIEVRHILESGNAVQTRLLEDRLVDVYHDGLFQLSLFEEDDSRTDIIRRAYRYRFREAIGQPC